MDNATMEMFGLTARQLRIMYSIEVLETEQDISADPKHAKEKLFWKKDWELELKKSGLIEYRVFFNRATLLDAIREECEKSENKTWFYLAMLEAALFTPYFPLNDSKETIKQ